MMIKIGYNKSDRHYGFSTHYECPDRINVCVRNLKKFYSNEYFITNLDSSLKGTESDSDTELVQYESILELIKHSIKLVEISVELFKKQILLLFFKILPRISELIKLSLNLLL
jgi:uncharacterized protein YwqG